MEIKSIFGAVGRRTADKAVDRTLEIGFYTVEGREYATYPERRDLSTRLDEGSYALATALTERESNRIRLEFWRRVGRWRWPIIAAVVALAAAWELWAW